ncbi:MAG: adenylate/guanylate cyclase domain-containing protein [Limisphaerales bacterium]
MKSFGLKLGLGEIFSGASAVAMTSNSFGFSFYYSLFCQLLLVAGALLILSMRKNRNILKPEHKAMQDAVIGIVDIVNSTEVCNTLDIVASFEMKRKFQKIAHDRASQNGIAILNDTGDGFLFLANPNGALGARELARFYGDLTTEFKMLVTEVSLSSGKTLESGLRFGVASGSVILGGLDDKTQQMTAVGPAVNLAARLCSRAGVDEIVFSAKVWERVNAVMIGWISESKAHADLKGFHEIVPAVHTGIFSKRDKPGSHLSVATLSAA